MNEASPSATRMSEDVGEAAAQTRPRAAEMGEQAASPAVVANPAAKTPTIGLRFSLRWSARTTKGRTPRSRPLWRSGTLWRSETRWP